MAILVVGETMWASLSDTFKLDAMQRYDIKTISDAEYQKMWAEIIKVTGSAPKEDDKSKGKGGKKQKKDEETED